MTSEQHTPEVDHELLPPAPPEPAIRRFRDRPMWGCVRGLFFFGVVVFLLLVLGGGGMFWYIGSDRFEDLIRRRIEETLERRLGRDVTIKHVTLIRGRQARVILDDIRIANAKGTTQPYFATARQVELTGGIDSFWFRKVKVGRVDIRDAHLFFEVLPDGTHNFPRWKSGPPSRFEIVRVDVSKLFVTGGAFDFLDRRHDIRANVSQISSEITPTIRKQIYTGVMTSPSAVLQIQDYEPFSVNLRGGFNFVPDSLELRSVALRGEGIEAFLSGRIAPLKDVVYNLNLSSRIELARVRQIFRIDKTLEGTTSISGTLAGKQGEYRLSGKFVSPRVEADTYELSDLKGRLDVNSANTTLDIDSGRYGGGSISAHYFLTQYAEPYPMRVHLAYNRISLEKLFSDWTVENTGLRGAASGALDYGWNKDQILAGKGQGTATIAPGAVAFGGAKYPMPLSGKTNFALDRGVVLFRDSAVSTGKTNVAFSGSLRLENLVSDLALNIHSSDFSELDKIGYNFAHSAGKRDYELLGLGGSGDLRGTVRGSISKSPMVVAHIDATRGAYRNTVIGDGALDLTYDGVHSVLTFNDAHFREGDGTLAMRGTIAFPSSGPSPRFDLDIDASGYPVERAIALVALDLKVSGSGTGHLHVSGTPENGEVRFDQLRIADGNSRLNLNGTLAWLPGKGNVKFDLDIGAQDVPVEKVAAFLDFGELPASGTLTGTLHLAGTKKLLEGAGSVVVTNGVIAGEPVDKVTADILFTQGKMRATNVEAQSPAGVISGEVEYDLNTEKFGYLIRKADVDISKVKALSALAGVLGGTLHVTSTGAGTLAKPELVLEGTLENAQLRGVALPVGAPPPTFYIAIREGQLVIRASAFDLVTVEGTGSVADSGEMNGDVTLHVVDVGRLLALFTPTMDIAAAGPADVQMKLSGNVKKPDTIRLDGTMPDLALTISGHEVRAAEPIRFSYAGGKLSFDTFRLKTDESSFSIAGYVDLTGDRALNISIKGLVEAALIQLIAPDFRANGHVNVDARLGGTLDKPAVNGTAEIQNADVKLAGFPQLITGVTGTVIFRGDRVEIDSLKANVGGGTVVAGGGFTMEGLTPRRIRVSLNGTDVALRYFEGISLDGDFNLVLSGDFDRMVLQGDVSVDRALYSRNFDFTTSILNLLLERRGVLPAVAAAWQDNVAMRIHLEAPGTLAVRNNIADVTGSATLDVGGTLANPVVLGAVTIDEGGKVRFQDIDYRVVRGTINFQNPFRIDPYFDITAEGRVQEYELTINLTGTIDHPHPVITSDPPAGDLTLLSLVTGNIGQNATTTTTPGAQGGLTTWGTSLLAKNLGQYLGSKILPFADAVRIEPGLTGSAESVVTFEKRVSQDVRVVVTQGTSSQRQEQLIEWQVTPEWVLQFTHQSESASSARRQEFALDGRFRRRYPGRWGGSRDNNRDIVNVDTPLEPTRTALDEAQTRAAVDAARAAAATGSVVTALEFRPDTNFDTSRLPSLVQTKLGTPLSIRNEQDSIKALYSTGDFRDIRVDVNDNGSTASVTYILSVNYRYDDLQLDGFGETRSAVTREMRLRRNDVFSLSAVDRTAEDLRQLLVRRGYTDATVDPEVNFTRATNRADVIFHATLGAETKIRDVQIEGNLAPFDAATLRETSKLRAGRAFRVASARDAADRIERYLVRRGYRRADVRYVNSQYDATTHTAAPLFRVEVGPKVEVVVTGVPHRWVHRWVPFGRREPYSEDRIDRARDRVVEELQRRGYYFATVDVDEKEANNKLTVEFRVNPGKKYDIGTVTFSGNHALSDKELAGVVATSKVGGVKRILTTIFRRPTGTTQRQLGADRDAIEAYYRLHGFTQTRVESAVVTPTPEGTINIVFPITEGPQTIVRDVHVEGNEQSATKELPALTVTVGKPFNPLELTTDVSALQTFYGDLGNIEVQVKPHIELSPDKTEAKIIYSVAEGPRVKVDQVIVRGNDYTKTRVITRTASLKQGEPFSYRNLLEAQRNLQRLAIFQRVDVQPETANTTTSERNVVIDVAEGNNLTVAGAIGYSTEQKARGSISISHRNLFGTARYLGLDARISQRQQRIFATYREPFTFNTSIPTQITAYRDDDLRNGAEIHRLGVFAEASRVFLEQTRWSLRYEWRNVRCVSGDLCNVPRPGMPREDQSIRISSITPTFFWDKRNDAVNPTRGFFASSSVEYAFPLTHNVQRDASGSATGLEYANFLKGFAQGAWYLGVTQRSDFVLSGRFGAINPFGSHMTSDVNPVPISERFVAGGETSHRGFSIDTLGRIACVTPKRANPDDPKPPCVVLPGLDANGILSVDEDGEILSSGGNGLVVLNAEYRFPIFGSLGGALFVDAGNVWRDMGDIDFGDLRYGVGTGVRYLTPVGPIRFDVGYKLDAQRPYEDRVAFFFSLGFPF